MKRFTLLALLAMLTLGAVSVGAASAPARTVSATCRALYYCRVAPPPPIPPKATTTTCRAPYLCTVRPPAPIPPKSVAPRPTARPRLR